MRLSARPWIGIATRWSARAASSAGRPQASLPNSQAVGPASRSSAVVEVDLAGAVGGEHGAARRACAARDGGGRVGLDRERQVEQAADAGPDGLGVVGVDASARPARRASAPAASARADHGAGVAGVADVGADRHAAAAPRSQHVGRAARRGSGRRRPRPAGVTASDERGEGAVVDQRSSAGAASRQRGVLLGGGGGREHLDDAAGDARAPSTAFGPSARKSRRSVRTERRLSFRASLTRALPAVSGARVEAARRRQAEASTLGALTSSGRAALAASTSAANAGDVVDGQVGQDLAVDLDTGQA